MNSEAKPNKEELKTEKTRGGRIVASVPAFSVEASCAYIAQNAIGPWPMHEVVPRAVRAAVRITLLLLNRRITHKY